MSRGKHRKLKKLGEKLLALRIFSNLTQKEIFNFINETKKGSRSIISHFETGKSEPSLYQIFKYTELANKYSQKNIRIEDLIDDRNELNFHISDPSKNEKDN